MKDLEDECHTYVYDLPMFSSCTYYEVLFLKTVTRWQFSLFLFSFFLEGIYVFSHILAIINRRVWIRSLADPQAEDPSLKLAGLPLYSELMNLLYKTGNSSWATQLL